MDERLLGSEVVNEKVGSKSVGNFLQRHHHRPSFHKGR